MVTHGQHGGFFYDIQYIAHASTPSSAQLHSIMLVRIRDRRYLVIYLLAQGWHGYTWPVAVARTSESDCWRAGVTLRAKQFIYLTSCTEHYAVLHTLCEVNFSMQWPDRKHLSHQHISRVRGGGCVCVSTTHCKYALVNVVIRRAINFQWQSIHCIAIVSGVASLEFKTHINTKRIRDEARGRKNSFFLFSANDPAS